LASLVVALWAFVVLILLVRGMFWNSSHTVVQTYLGAGRHWLAGEPLYKGGRGYVYSPLVAAFFAPLAQLPLWLSMGLWLFVSMAAYIGSVAWALRARLFPQDGNATYPLVFLLLLPLSIGNFSNAQVNPLVTALLLGGIVALKQGQMTLAAFLLAAPVYFKIYPLAMGLVLMAAFPRRFSWRFLLALAALAGLSFVLQHPTYVASQYQLWYATRSVDNRRFSEIEVAPRDLWMILKLLHVPLVPTVHYAYTAFQVASGAAIAVLAVLGRCRFGWTDRRVLVTVLCLVDAWMLLCGPATESATYIMLAPAAALALVQSLEQGFPPRLRARMLTAYGVFLLALGINSFIHPTKTNLVMSIQPIGALVFVCFVIPWVMRVWKPQAARDQAASIDPGLVPSRAVCGKDGRPIAGG
jgi:Glycosyltransferase family 87